MELSQKIKFKTDTETAKAIQPMVREKMALHLKRFMHASPFDRQKWSYHTNEKAKIVIKRKENATNIPSLHQESQYSLLPIVEK